MDQQRNLILAFALSMIVMLGWGMLVPEPEVQQEQAQQATVKEAGILQTREALAPASPMAVEAVRPQSDLEASPPAELLEISNNYLTLQVDPNGGNLVGARLSRYHQEADPGSGDVDVLEHGPAHALRVTFGIANEKVTPKFQLIDRQDGAQNAQLTLQFTLEDGRIWQRSFNLKPDSYLVTVKDRISGGGGERLYRQVVEHYPDREASTFYEFTGPVGLLDDQLQEIGYDDLDESSPVLFAAQGGWTGIMNRYFIAAILGESDSAYRYYFKGDGLAYQAGQLDDGSKDGDTWQYSANLYIGPKSITEMSKLGVGLERAVDFGWFTFIAQPLHDLLLYFYRYVPNFGWCIIFIVILIKLLFFWPTKKSYESMAVMRKLQPEMARLKELYGDDRQKMSQEMMALYKKHKANPLGGCLPIIIQIPVFFALYKVLLMSIEMRHAPFLGWIQDLSAQDPYFVLPLLMGVSMFVQQRLNPQPPDPIQAKVMQFLPVLFTGLFLFFPSGLVLYWCVNNILSIIQQWFVLKQQRAL